jgi:hypothetical protein
MFGRTLTLTVYLRTMISTQSSPAKALAQSGSSAPGHNWAQLILVCSADRWRPTRNPLRLHDLTTFHIRLPTKLQGADDHGHISM